MHFGPEVKTIEVIMDASPPFIFLDLCLQLGLFIIIYIFSIRLICGYALLSLYVISFVII